MNILFISTEIPYPPDHGHHIRTYNILRYLSSHHNVSFIGFAKNNGEMKYKTYLEQICDEVHVFLIPGAHHRFCYVVALLLNLFFIKPYTVKRFFFKKAVKQIDMILENRDLDLVHVDMLHLGMYYRLISALPSILVNHNVESLRLKRLMKVQKNLIVKAYLYLQYVKLLKFERQICPKFNKCIVVSKTDREILKKICSANNFEIVPNGVDTGYFSPVRIKEKPDSLVWVGNMADYYNKDAVTYFLEKILPLLQRELPALHVTFVGSSPTANIIKLTNVNKNIVAPGFVPDIRPYVAESKVFIAPIRSGSGTKIKILNAMAQAKPVLTTSVGAEGIDAEDGKDIMIADEAEGFARKAIYLLTNPEVARAIGRNARKIIEKYYTWDVIFKKMDDIYLSCLAGKNNVL